MDDSIQGDEKIQKKVDSYIGLVNGRVLEKENLSFHQVLAKADFDMRFVNDESNLGNLIADSIRWAVNRVDHDRNDPLTKVVVAIESNGVIRDDLPRGKTGNVVVCDLFRAVPLGYSRGDDTMGYPLITCYFHAHEIKKTMEVLTSIYPKKGSNFFLQVSGMKFKYNPNRVIFDRVTDIWLGSEEEGYYPLDYSESNKNLYRVATNIYNATFLSFIGRFTYGALDIVPKDRNGNSIVPKTGRGNPFDLLLSLRVDVAKEKAGIQELKEWIAVMDYVKSFSDKNGDGIPDIPEKYRGKLGRIVREPSWNPISLLSRGTYVTWIVFGGIMVLVFLAGLGVYFLTRNRLRRGSH
jgi:5'-nucleotidase